MEFMILPLEAVFDLTGGTGQGVIGWSPLDVCVADNLNCPCPRNVRVSCGCTPV